MQKNSIFVDINNLTLEVFVVGYPDKGESQIIFIKNKIINNVVFSCVIDCYKYKGVNKTIDILDQNGIELLDMFIWTHTDEDHSIGISDIVRRFCTNKTKFILPELVHGNEKDFVNYNKEIEESFKLINAFNTGSNYNVCTATVVPNGHSSIHKLIFIDLQTNCEIIFEILALAPCSPIIRRRWESGEVRQKNDLSIATIFKIGEINLLFSGDIENQTISLIADYHFENLSYIKTAHHTSTTSTNLISKIEDNCSNSIASAVSTIYKTHNLPHADVVEKYKKIVDKFYSTGLGDDTNGYTKTVFHIVSNSIIEECLFGNAIEL